MLDAKSLLDQLLASGARGGNLARSEDSPLPRALGRVAEMARGQGGGLAGGAVAGGLAALLLGSKTGRRLGENALKIGGLALLGGLAYTAYSRWKQNADPAQTVMGNDPASLPPPVDSGFAEPMRADRADDASRLFLRTMVAAARADGRMDQDERARVMDAMERADLSRDAKNYLVEILSEQDDIESIARECPTPEMAAELWLAARLAIDVDTQAEREFLEKFARALKIDPSLVTHLEATAAAAKDDHPTV